MKDEIKEILDFKEDADYKKLSVDEIAILEDYITNLQDTLKDREEYCYGLETQLNNLQEEHKNCTRKHWQQKCAEHCANEMIYKLRNEKAIKLLKYDMERYDLEDGYSTCEEALNLLQGEDNIPQENLYKYTPEKGFELVGDEDE